MAALLERARPPLELVSEWLALAGGIVLAGAAIFAVAAIGADAAGSPVLGDTEVMELAAAGAVASFLPFAQMRGAHVKITVFTDRLPRAVIVAIDTLAEVAFAVVATVLAWRLVQGGIDAFDRNRMTMFLELPLWWGYLAAAVPMIVWVVVTWFLAAEAVSGRPRRDATRPEQGFEEVGP